MVIVFLVNLKPSFKKYIIYKALILEVKIGKSIWDTVAPIIASIGAVAIGQPELIPIAAGIGSGVTTGVETGSPVSGLLSGIGSGLGSYAGGQLLGPELGGIGGSANAISGGATPGFLGQDLGGFAGNALAGQTLGGIAGSTVGGSIGSDLGTMAGGMLNPMNSGGGSGPPGFSPTMSPQMGLPQSLSQFGNLNPNQQASNIATKGVYGGGNGPDETNYFLNLMNRQQFDQNGNLGSSVNSSPIDQSYLSQLGISGYNDPTSLVKGISQYGT